MRFDALSRDTDLSPRYHADGPFIELARGRSDTQSVMACLYTGASTPAFCSPMLRQPMPPVGMRLDGSFGQHLVDAVRLNPSVHDGAVMVGRSDVSSAYAVSGWSFRLFPPDLCIQGDPNRGSAFNSCLCMSVVEGVDVLYLVSGREVLRFRAGTVATLQGRYTD